MSNGLKGLVVLAAVLLPGRMYAMEATTTAVPVPCDAAALDGGCAEKAINFVAAGYTAGKATTAVPVPCDGAGAVRRGGARWRVRGEGDQFLGRRLCRWGGDGGICWSHDGLCRRHPAGMLLCDRRWRRRRQGRA